MLKHNLRYQRACFPRSPHLESRIVIEQNGPPSGFAPAVLAATFLWALEADAAVRAEVDPNVRARQVIATFERTIRPLEVQAARCGWEASLSGKIEDYRKQQQSQAQIGVCLAQSQSTAELKALFEQRPSDPLLARQIDVLYRQYLAPSSIRP